MAALEKPNQPIWKLSFLHWVQVILETVSRNSGKKKRRLRKKHAFHTNKRTQTTRK